MIYKAMHYTDRAKAMKRKWGIKTALFFAQDEMNVCDKETRPYYFLYWESVYNELQKSKWF